MKHFDKERSKGVWFWKAKRQPTPELAIKVMLEEPGVLESDMFNEHKASNLGEYNKEEVKKYLKTLEDGGDK